MANSSPRKVNGFEEDLRQVTGKNCIFPLEVFECIADSLIHFLPAQAHNGGPIHSSKPPFTDVCGFMSASMRLHCIGMARWVRMLTIRAPEDWETALKRSYLVRFVFFSFGRFRHSDAITCHQRTDMSWRRVQLVGCPIRSSSVSQFAHDLH
jgi:hypothetical protein